MQKKKIKIPQPRENIEFDFKVETMKMYLHMKPNDCHHNARYIYQKLRDFSYDVKLRTGVYVNLPKAIRHSWIEYKDKILEIDCRQLSEGEGDLMPNVPFAILLKESIGHRYKNSNEIEINEQDKTVRIKEE
jgi:hypothetical protein